MTHSTLSRSTGEAIIWHCADTSRFAQASAYSPRQHCIELVIETLHSNGYKTTALQQEHQIAKQVITQQPDLLIIHLQTAEDRGYALCEKLRTQSSTYHLPIIFVGARAESSERLNILRCGGSAYLQLPASSEECWLLLQQHLNTARLVRKLQADKMNLSQKVGEYDQIVAQQEQFKLFLTQENQVLQKLAFIDGLTQVANRRSFTQNIAQCWQEAYEDHQPLSLLLCDIDYFKRYNDVYGHIEGDRCLRAVADALVRGTHREQDQVARYGGEEFAIILPSTELMGAQRVALSVQSEIARAQIPHKGSLSRDHISLSIGICTLIPHSADQPHEVLVQKADEALYAAKLWGRDRTVTNTANGLLSAPENYCLYNYAQNFTAFSETRPGPALNTKTSQLNT